MRTLSNRDKTDLIGEYHAPEGLYEYIKSLPFLGQVSSNVERLVAGTWEEIIIAYEVGGAGLADGAWIKGAFKFYSDWALFQTSNREADNYVSAEYVARELLPGQTPATVDSLKVRFDQKGHERPFQKAVIVDIVDGYLNPGDKIILRLGDRRWGGRGTRVQSFVEKGFRWRFFIDPIGTSKFAPIPPDLVWDIVPGEPHHLKVITPRLVQPGVKFKVHVHVEDIWGNTVENVAGCTVQLNIEFDHGHREDRTADLPFKGWANVVFKDVQLLRPGLPKITAILLDDSDRQLLEQETPISASENLIVPKALFGDLHVHSDDTVGTFDSLYNFSYGRDISGLDFLGYTANDFQITKAKWDATVKLIEQLHEVEQFVIFPGTEWCGNSAAGGDHNVVFLADPALHPPKFPFDEHGNVARSFEWSEDGPAELIPGAWPLEELYATYAGESDTHLLIPHVGGRRCNLSWHHPRLERLVEIGSAWGHFEWLLRDALQRGWKVGVSANSDEHRGRCGGGVPGTAVFGTKGGLTGIVAPALDRLAVAQALRARHTFATTGPRLVGLTADKKGHIQGDELQTPASVPFELDYQFYGHSGFAKVEAFDASGRIWHRDLRQESKGPADLLRVTWGGARLYDRYREATWDGTIVFSGISNQWSLETFGGFTDNPEDSAWKDGPDRCRFVSRTSGDMDGVLLDFGGDLPEHVTISGKIGGYVKVGDPLKGQPHAPQPTFELQSDRSEYSKPDGHRITIAGGVDLFVQVEAVPRDPLPTDVQGHVTFNGSTGEHKAIYFVGTQWNGEKVVTSPMFIDFV